MIALVERLVASGVAYQAEDGSVYFAIDRFPGYGRLSRLDTREIKAGARVVAGRLQQGERAGLRALEGGEGGGRGDGAAWDSPWGRGRPGWHLECSAMAMDLLGETLDLHCGGIDLVFPHHEDEIAQSEAATGETFSRVWCHGAFLLTDGAKMAKRVGNVATVQGLRERGSPARRCGTSCSTRTIGRSSTCRTRRSRRQREAVRRVGEFAARLRRRRRWRHAGAGDDAAAAAEREVRGGAVRRPERARGAGGAVRRSSGGRMPSSTADGTDVAGAGARRGRRSAAIERRAGPRPRGGRGRTPSWQPGSRSGSRRGGRRGRGAISRRPTRIRDELAARGVEIKDTAAGHDLEARR